MEEGGGGEGGEEEEDEEDSDSEGEDGVNVIIDQKRIEEDKTKTIQSMQVNIRKLFLSSDLSLYEEEMKNTEYYRDRDESLQTFLHRLSRAKGREGWTSLKSREHLQSRWDPSLTRQFLIDYSKSGLRRDRLNHGEWAD